MRAVSLILSLILVAACARADPPKTVRIETADGPVEGVMGDNFDSFKNIPYAAAPIGPLRWQKPQPHAKWTAPLDAADFGPSCMQSAPPPFVPPGSHGAETSEDCLKLNIWRPAGAARAPVMVWIHGGGNVTGSPADFFMDGHNFAKDGVVLVSVAYRVGAFGFFSHPALGKAANFGLWDQVAALQWVKANIASFGGDPDNVTLFGESAGGEDVLALMTAPAARGLFHKAIAESAGGGWGPPLDVADLSRMDATAAGKMGATTPAQLLALSAGDVLKINTDATDPVVDHDLLPEAPMNAFADGSAAHIPLIIGTNSEEGSLIGDDRDVTDLFPKLTADDVAAVRALYGDAARDDGAFARLLFRDGYFTSPARAVARAEDGYLYRFDYVLSPLRWRRSSAWHGSEVPLVFEQWPSPVLNDDDHRLQAALHDCWIAFARTGKPDCTGAPGWQSVSHGSEMVYDLHPSAREPADQPVLDRLEKVLAPK